MMTQRERYLAVVLYQPYDRIPFAPGEPRQSTLAAWHRQGLPADASHYDYLTQVLGIEAKAWAGTVTLPVNERMIPEFEEKILERKEGTIVVQDWKGNVCEILDIYDPTYLRNPIDFVTRKWIKCPVASRADWEQMKGRYDVDSPGRWPPGFAASGRTYQQRDYPLRLSIAGPFWQLREWLGLENLCLLFYDDPALVADMIQFWDDFVAALLARTFAVVVPDILHFAEDVAYKLYPMISPAMTRKYLAPCWQHWTDLARQAGVPVCGIDSDGYIHDLVPIWLENGINMCDPIEVAAGNDLSRLRELGGRRMAFAGGVDKRAIAAGGAVIAEEMARIAPVVAGGGYIPGCDHGVPPDISWPNFVAYARILAQQTGWL